jgi:hypothetical protein
MHNVLLLALAVTTADPSAAERGCNDGAALVSAGVLVGSGLIDIFTAPGSARRSNRINVGFSPGHNADGVRYHVALSWSPGKPRESLLLDEQRLPSRPAPPAPKSPGRAFALSGLSTVVPMVLGPAMRNGAGALLFASGLVVGPSVGHFYAGQSERGLLTAALRGAASALFVASVCWDA